MYVYVAHGMCCLTVTEPQNRFAYQFQKLIQLELLAPTPDSCFVFLNDMDLPVRSISVMVPLGALIMFTAKASRVVYTQGERKTFRSRSVNQFAANRNGSRRVLSRQSH